jgi:formate hydrogenlyase transcriptional activator
LQNVLERSVILTNGSTLQVSMPELKCNSAPVPLNGRPPAEVPNGERARILKALEEARGQVGGPDGAAARLGLKRTTLQSRMKKYNIAREFR